MPEGPPICAAGGCWLEAAEEGVVVTAIPPEWAAGGLDTAPPSLLYTVTPVVPGAGPPGCARGRLICEPPTEVTLGLDDISI